MIQKVTENEGVYRELHTSHFCFFCSLKDDKHRDYLAWKEGGKPTGMLWRCLRGQDDTLKILAFLLTCL